MQRVTVSNGVWRVLNFYNTDTVPYGIRIYNQTSGYNGDYPLIVSKTPLTT